MRKYTFTILLLCACFSAFSQVILAPMHWKNGKDLFDTLSVSGGFQHQILGAKTDGGRLEYLEPLVQGAFVVSDSEINVASIAPAMYDLRDGQKYVPTTGGVFAKDNSATYFTDYGVRRFLYNPQTQKTFYVGPDSGWSQIGSGNVFNLTVDTTINNTSNYITNDNSTYYTFADSSFLDARDFYNDGTITSPYRIIRYDNHYIDSLFASIVATGGTVNNYYGSRLPYNGDTSYYLAGDSALHKLPAFTGSTATLQQLKLTTNGQSGPSTLDTATNTLNVPNYFFAAVSDSNNIDYSLSAMTTIYSEKGPGEYITSGHGVTVNPDNFNFPFKQLKSLDISGWNAGDYVSFSNSTTANSTAYTFMRAFIRLKQAVPVIQSLSFQFYLNGVAVSKIISMVNYGLDKSMINKYQNISIPMSAFGFTDNNFDEIRLIFGGGSSPDGLYLDLFQFQNATTTENKYVTDVFRIPGTTTVQKVLGGQNSFAFNDSVGAAVDTQYLRRDINLKLNIADTTNKWMPRNTPIVTAFNGRAGNVLPQLSDYSAYYAAINHTHSEGDVSNLVTDLAGKWDVKGNAITAGVSFLGSTNNVSLRFRTNNKEAAVLDSLGNLGVGDFGSAKRPDTHLHIVDAEANNSIRGIAIEQTSSNTHGAAIVLRKTRGTFSSPTPVVAGDYIGGTGFWPRTSSGYILTAEIGAKVGDVVAGSTVPSEVYIATSPTSYLEPYLEGTVRFIVKPTGNVLIGTTIDDPSAILNLSSTTKGMLPPRMTKAQRNAIGAPAQGVMVFVTDNTGYLSYYNNGWMKVTAQQDP